MRATSKLISIPSTVLVTGLVMALSSGLQAAAPSQNYIVDHDFEGVDPGSIAEWEGWWMVNQKSATDDEWCEPVDCAARLKTVRRGTTGQHVLEVPGLEYCCTTMGDSFTYESWPCDDLVVSDRLWPWFNTANCHGCPVEGPFTDTQPTAFQLVELGEEDCEGSHLTLRFDYIAPASPSEAYVYVLHAGIMTHEAGAAEDDWQYPGSVAIPASTDWRTAEISIEREDNWDAAVVFFRYRYVPCYYTYIYKNQPNPAYCICRCDKACKTGGFDACHLAEVTGVLVDDVYLFEASTETGLVTHDYPYEEVSPGGLGGDDEFFPDPRIEAYRPGGEDEIIERLTDVEAPVKRLESESFMELVALPQVEACMTSCTTADPPAQPCSGDIIVDDVDYVPSLQQVGTCPADFNDDGIVNGADLSMLLADWNATNSIADLNCDDNVDGGDLALLLAAWGFCNPLQGLIAPPNL